jgi:dipeptidyl aminopeptidase/acylaminoacyl peptidase
MRRLVFFLLALLFAFPAFPQAKHPFTFEDMMKLRRIAEPVPSPDGKWVLFAAVDVDLAANKKTSHIWVVPVAGGQPKEIIADQDGDRPRWAPDGKRFAFLSTKEGGSQVWIADFDGAAGIVRGVHQLTHMATEASGELWSPDGQSILFTSDVYPECDNQVFVKEYNCNLGKRDEAEKSKVKAFVFDHLLYRHWNAYKAGKRSHIFVMPAPAPEELWGPFKDPKQRHYSNWLFYRDLTPGDYDAPQFSLGGQDNYAFSPDGREICYTSNHDKVEATSTNNDLWIVPVNGGAAKNITADNPASDSTPLYSPDGKYIAYRAQQRPGYESDRFRLILYDRKTGAKKSVGDKLDRWVDSFTWSADSLTLYFVAESKGDAPIYEVQAESGHGKELVHAGGYSDELAIVPGGKILLFTQMSAAFPNQIRKYELAKGKGEGEKLADLNEAVLSQVIMTPLESFWFTGAMGDPIQGFLMRPPNPEPNKDYPLKFIIHGGPEVPMGDLWSYRWNAELFAASGYVVIMINFHGSPGYGQKFIDEINGDWGGAPFEDLMKGLDYAEAHYPIIDKHRECALGASYGGYMANWALGHTDRFKCIVTHDGMFNTYSAWGTTEELWFNNWEFKGTPYTNPEMYEKWNPRNSAKNFKTPTLVIHSQLDYRLDVSEGFQLFTTLQTMGVPSRMLYFPDEGHWILKPQNSELWYQTVNDWVDQWTKK